jgi:hypothetical protein
MKKALLVLSLTAMYFAGSAQVKRRPAAPYSTTAKPGRFSLGFEAGLPLGENGKVYSHILGGSLQYETMPSSDLGITFSGGYLNWSLKSQYRTPYGPNSAGFIPLLAGVKYYFTPAAFFHAQLGAAVGTRSGQGTSFAYSPGIGFRLSPNLDAEIKYMGISNKGGTLDEAGLRLAYNF